MRYWDGLIGCSGGVEEWIWTAWLMTHCVWQLLCKPEEEEDNRERSFGLLDFLPMCIVDLSLSLFLTKSNETSVGQL